ncbi:MAG: DnaA regulatory inactivator Hda [Gammaproteobacteria bacterium]|nr:MAG: DnaA regulatory inactivator Hda [Gammaproteobacteria bacterium]
MQLPLAIRFPEAADFAAFEPGANRLLVELLQAAAAGGGERQLYLWGEAGVGKTHLLQAACRAAAARGPAAWLPAAEALRVGPDCLHGWESAVLLAVDEVERLAGDAAWERALFDLINRARAAGTRLLFAGRRAPAAVAWGLPDLASRLAWGPVFRVQPLDDTGKLAVLQRRARRRGFELSAEVGRYLLSRLPRDLPTLCAGLDALDRASLAEQRRLTIPFVKKVFGL